MPAHLREPKFAILCAFLRPRHFASGLLNEVEFLSKKDKRLSFSTFYANTCISTTIVACYFNNSSGRARGEVLRIFG